ncbi:hypothetical protein [Leifsonia sp. 1010]|uniref:hypothetical protein n=1 Tax=Leifsonia sp. 1010 TaxID=2817769 RepID=UPI00285B1E19|nr:hypothetical protein [Leifsonia sp. 1010]MDR6612137.1 hypothetical protein [Leifsonia sp. 1010]
MQTPRSGPPRRLHVPLVVLLIVGVLVTVAGEGWFLTAKDTVASSAQRSNSLPTLPVHVYAQYTQHLPAIDTSGLWTGLLIAGSGIAVLLAAAAVAIRRSYVR